MSSTPFQRDQKQLACDILYRILSCMPPGRALDRYEDMFLEGLSHPENLVKELILREVIQTLSSERKPVPDCS